MSFTERWRGWAAAPARSRRRPAPITGTRGCRSRGCTGCRSLSDPPATSPRGAFLASLQVCHGHHALTTPLWKVEDLLDETDPARAARVLGHGVRVTEAVPAALLAFLRAPDNPAEVMRFALRMGGNTDTITAMATAIAGARCGADALPPAWRSRTDLTSAIASAADRLIDTARAAPYECDDS